MIRSEHLVRAHFHVGGVRRLYKFPNGLEASAICGPLFNGGDLDRWEVACFSINPDPIYNLTVDELNIFLEAFCGH